MLSAGECELRAEEFDARAKSEADITNRQMFDEIAVGYRELALQVRARETLVKP
jgi:hypothetical protein